jgi:hypothetical protein
MKKKPTHTSSGYHSCAVSAVWASATSIASFWYGFSSSLFTPPLIYVLYYIY